MNNNINTTNHTIITIPLNKLTAWDGNVRKTGAADGIDELAASIASHGLLQSLVVKPAGKSGKRGQKGGNKYAVIAGRRRFLALTALAKAGTIERDAPVPCHVVSGEIDPAELSLAENIVRMPMHPADQFEAFRDLIDKGSSVADVAARFYIAESAVSKRLKLGRLSPSVLAAYRAAEIGLEEAQAFALSDDHAAQERVLQSLSMRGCSPAAIRRALTEGEVPATDKRVRFVGLDAYAAAGGAVRRDLFDDEDGGYVLDEAVLDRLVIEGLSQQADPVRAEGWKWVEVHPDIDHAALSEFSRRWPESAPLPEDEQAELERLSSEYDELVDDDEDGNAERLAQIERRIEELNEQAQSWPALTLAMAGAIISLGYDGCVRIERGLVRKDDERALKAAAKASKEAPGPRDGVEGGAAFSASLTGDLTSCKTAALRAALSMQPDVALAAVVHRLALESFYTGAGGFACLELSVPASTLRKSLAKPDDCKALVQVERDCERTCAGLPANPAQLWEWCLSQSRDALLDLLALCAALTVNAVQGKGDPSGSRRLRHADALARALKLDMSAWFTPGAENYFGRVSRTHILAAVQEATGNAPAPAWAKMKKSELAVLAERQITGTGWLPGPVRIAQAACEADNNDADTDTDTALAGEAA